MRMTNTRTDESETTLQQNFVMMHLASLQKLIRYFRGIGVNLVKKWGLIPYAFPLPYGSFSKIWGWWALGAGGLESRGLCLMIYDYFRGTLFRVSSKTVAHHNGQYIGMCYIRGVVITKFYCMCMTRI